MVLHKAPPVFCRFDILPHHFDAKAIRLIEIIGAFALGSWRREICSCRRNSVMKI